MNTADIDLPARLHRLKNFSFGELGLGPYLATVFALMSFVLTAVLGEFIGAVTSKETKNDIGRNLQELAVQASGRLDRGMFERYREIQVLAQSRLVRLEQSTPEQQRNVLNATQASYPYYAWIGLADRQGKVSVASQGILEGADVSQRPWFRGALNGQYLMDVHEAKMLAKLLPNPRREPLRFLDVAFPLLDGSGRPTSVLGAHLSWEWAREVQQSIVDTVESERRVEMLIVGRDQTVLLGPTALQGTVLKTSAVSLAKGKTEGYTVERWPDGREFLVGYSRSNGYSTYPGMGWTVMIRQDLDNAYAPVKDLQRRTLVVGFVIATLFSLLGLFVARRFTQPIARVADAAGRIERGEIVAVDQERGAYREVIRLTGSLNSLVAKLMQNESALRELNATLEKKVALRTAELAGALERVKGSESRIAAILASSQDAFVAVSFDGRIADCNRRAEEMFGWSRAEAIGRPASELLTPPRFQGSFDKALGELRATGHIGMVGTRMERIAMRRDGHEFPVEVTIGIAQDGGKPFVSAFLHDISERKKIERMKSEFISTVSHELRTPLTSIRMSLGMLQDGTAGTLPPGAAQLTAIAHESCERLVRLVNDILDVEKIESGTIEMRIGQVRLLPLLQESARNVAGYAREFGASVEVAESETDFQIAADEDRMVQVIVNLLSNAVKYSPPGGVVTVAAQAHLLNGEPAVRITVTDRGPGIPDEFHSRIFGRFAQAETADGKRRGGTGLGLAICKDLVEAQGGQISFSSTPGEGARFFVDMPLAPHLTA